MGDNLQPSVPNDENYGKIQRRPSPSWRALFNFTVRRHAATLLFALILTALSGLIVPILAILFGRIFAAFSNYGSGNIDGDGLKKQILPYTVAIVCLGGATWLSNGLYCMAWMTFGALQAREVRDRLFQDLLDKEVE